MSATDEPEKLERRKTISRISARRDLEDVAFVLSTVEGRRCYWGLMRRCGIHRSSFTGNNTTFFNEGERNIGLQMLSDLEEADPTAYAKCLSEAKEQELKRS